MAEAHLAKNTIYFTLASIAQKVISLAYFTVIANVIGVDDNGAYFLALGIATILAVFEDVGLTSVTIREVAKHPEDAAKWSRVMLGWKLVSIPLSILLAICVPLIFGYDAELTTLIHLAIFIMIADTLSLSLYGVLRGLQNLRYESLGIFVGQSITTILGITFVFLGIATLPMLMVALIVGSTWNVVFSGIQILRRLGWSALKPSFELGFTPLKAAFAFFLAAIFSKLYAYADSLILHEVLGTGAVGLYAVANKFTYAFQFLPLAFVAALYPTMSSQAHNPQELKRILLQGLWYMALMAFPIVGGIFALAPEIIGTFMSADYLGSILPLQILIFVLIFLFLDYPLGSLLNATGHQYTQMTIMGIVMVLNILLNLVLIPLFGLLGACIAALISFFVMFASGWMMVRRIVPLGILDFIKATWGIVLGAILMVAIVLLVKPYMHFAFVIPLGACVYGLTLLCTKMITTAHWQSFRALIHRKPYVTPLSPDA